MKKLRTQRCCKAELRTEADLSEHMSGASEAHPRQRHVPQSDVELVQSEVRKVVFRTLNAQGRDGLSHSLFK